MPSSYESEALAALVAALVAFPDIDVTAAEYDGAGWCVDCLMTNIPTGEQSLSVIAFVADRQCPEKYGAAPLDLVPGGQHDAHPGRGCFFLAGRELPPGIVAEELALAYRMIREREGRN
jgi:hypothetical protein